MGILERAPNPPNPLGTPDAERLPVAEDKGEREEEEFEFTPAGESVVRISMEQARFLAIKHAKEDTGFYGNRYRGISLAHEVASEQEEQDYFDIRLAFRPAGRFRGTAGVELFVVDKAGTVRIRHVLQEPVGSRIPSLLLGAADLLVAGAIWVVSLFARPLWRR